MATITSNGTGGGVASATGSWAGGVVPVEGDKVVIAAGDTITVDGTYTWGDDSVTATIPNAAVNVSGKLKASRTVNSSLAVKGLLLYNYGTHAVDYGDAGDVIPGGVTATLILNKATTPAVRAGMQQVQPPGGTGNYMKWSFYGDDSRERGVNLAADATNASADITLVTAAHGWKVGDEVAFFTTTDNTTTDQCETRTISSIASAVITLSSAPTYTHVAGSPVCNLTCNVIVKSYNEVSGQMANPSGMMPNSPSPVATNGYWYKFSNTRFQNFGSTSVASGVLNSGGAGSGANSGYQMHKCVVFNDKTSASVFNVAAARTPVLTETVMYMNGAFGYQSACDMDGCWAAMNQSFLGGASSNYAQVKNTWVTGRGAGFQMTLPAGSTVDNLTLSGTGVSVAAVNVDMEFKNSDLGYTYGWETFYAGDYMFRLVSVDATGGVRFRNCLLDSEVEIPASAANMANQSEFLRIDYIDKGQDVTAQETYYAAGTIKRNNSTTHRSASSFAFTHNKIASNVTRTQEIPCANGASIRVIGYCRFDTSFYNANDYTAPTVALSGLGETTQTYTATSAANGAWEKFDLTITNNSGNDGNFTLTYTANAKTVTTGTVYFDGVPDAPFVTKCRHYGFLFNESNPVRETNITTSANEATAAAYTGMAVTWGASASSVAVTASNTIQKLYDYTQAQACLNIASALPLTGAGIAGNASLFAAGAVTVSDGAVLNGAGSLSMGSHLLSTEFSGGVNYTYTGGTWSQLTTVPTFNGGTLNLGAAGTYTFTSAGAMIWSMTPTAPGTYAMGGCTLTGQQDLRNTSGTHAITVELPSGASYTTANNTGAAITVSTPQVYQEVTISGATAGSRLQIYDTTSSTELYNGTPTFPYTWTDGSPAAADRAIRIRVSYVSGATAKNFIEANIGTCGQTSGTESVSYLVSQSADTTYDANAIDGSTVTGITIDDSIDRVKINIAGGSVSWPSIYAYQVYWLSTSAGIVDDGAFIEGVDTANYLLTGFDIRNINANPLTITGGWGRDSTTLTIAGCIDTAGSTGNIFPMPDHVVAYATGSALTAGQAAELSGIKAKTDSLGFTVSGKVDANIHYVNDLVVDGAGTEADPWGPA